MLAHRRLLVGSLLCACASSGEFETGGAGPTSATQGITSASASDSDTTDSDTTDSGDASDSADPSASGASSSPTSATTNPTNGATTDPTLDPSTTGDPTTAGDPTTSTGDISTGTTGDACGGPCMDPPGACYDPVGECVGGTCVYAPTPAGILCDDQDACTTGEKCDGGGTCGGGVTKECARPHTTGGKCVAGTCQGWKCVDPYEDCDNDMANGCEVPTGVANQCDAGGLNPNGCWTAYCGALNDAKAKNFGTYYCYDCANCNTPSPGQWQWCNHSNGQWYPPAAGNCGANEDLICAP